MSYMFMTMHVYMACMFSTLFYKQVDAKVRQAPWDADNKMGVSAALNVCSDAELLEEQSPPPGSGISYDVLLSKECLVVQ